MDIKLNTKYALNTRVNHKVNKTECDRQSFSGRLGQGRGAGGDH